MKGRSTLLPVLAFSLMAGGVGVAEKTQCGNCAETSNPWCIDDAWHKDGTSSGVWIDASRSWHPDGTCGQCLNGHDLCPLRLAQAKVAFDKISKGALDATEAARMYPAHITITEQNAVVLRDCQNEIVALLST